MEQEKSLKKSKPQSQVSATLQELSWRKLLVDQDIQKYGEQEENKSLQQLLNPTTEDQMSDNPPEEESESGSVPPDSIDIQLILYGLKNNKVPGSDCIPGEFLKEGGSQLL